MNSIEKTTKFVYGKDEAQCIKGIAIIMMFIHHLFAFPGWISEDSMYVSMLNFHGKSFAYVLAVFCKLCVGIYAFTTGYAMFVREHDYDTWRGRSEKIISFLKQYWIIYFIFIIIGIIISEPLPSIKLMIFQLFGIRTATGFDWKYFSTIHPVFGWYVSFYMLFIMLFPILKKFAGRGFWIDNIVYFLIFNGSYILIRDYIWINMPFEVDCILNRFTIWGNVGWIGYLFAKYDFFEKIDKKVRKLVRGIPLLVICMLVSSLMIVCRYKIGTIIIPGTLMSWDLLYTPILIYLLIVTVKILHNKYLEKVLKLLSRYSTDMWFLHGIFYTPLRKLQYIAYFPKIPILILVWSLVVILIAAMILEWGKNKVRLLNK